MTTKMYKLVRSGRDVDYVAIKDGRVVVHSDLLKNLWENPLAFEFEISTSYTLEAYYGDPDILKDAELLWTKE